MRRSEEGAQCFGPMAQADADRGQYTVCHAFGFARERLHRGSKLRRFSRPLRSGVGHGIHGSGRADIEDLLPVGHVLGEFAIIEAPTVLCGALDGKFAGAWQGKELPHPGQSAVEDNLRDAVTGDVKEAPLGAGVVDAGKRTRIKGSDVDYGYAVHRISSRDLSRMGFKAYLAGQLSVIAHTCL